MVTLFYVDMFISHVCFGNDVIIVESRTSKNMSAKFTRNFMKFRFPIFKVYSKKSIILSKFIWYQVRDEGCVQSVYNHKKLTIVGLFCNS